MEEIFSLTSGSLNQIDQSKTETQSRHENSNDPSYYASPSYSHNIPHTNLIHHHEESHSSSNIEKQKYNVEQIREELLKDENGYQKKRCELLVDVLSRLIHGIASDMDTQIKFMDKFIEDTQMFLEKMKKTNEKTKEIIYMIDGKD
ncbi:hypothetical protein FDP41_004089 [Naegleria fowleri]|uniref:Uncharacterized protein n=1 Tax=Naegleria fowleri TaxID=5763 RepID=A0A6A5BRJ0_NAEFO|nr:uncharacterized protein FDP41_004089 [Naegleria fowleri]KAF0976794.1 hypothetical protein FDP41_004089 [Naegleria fowleri]CAG4715565.1 unnamed protein product [Naegleria fowleri]